MIKKVNISPQYSVSAKHFVVPICSEEYLIGDSYKIYLGDYVERKFKDQYTLAGGKLPLGSVIHIKHPTNERNNYYGIVIFSKESGFIEDDKIKDTLNSISLPDGEELYVDDSIMGLNLSRKISHSPMLMPLCVTYEIVGPLKYNRPNMARALDMCNHNIVISGVNLPRDEIKSINETLSLRKAKIDSIVNESKDKFESMTYEEREEFLKKYDLDFYSSDEKTL